MAAGISERFSVPIATRLTLALPGLAVRGDPRGTGSEGCSRRHGTVPVAVGDPVPTLGADISSPGVAVASVHGTAVRARPESVQHAFPDIACA